jgi:hypothetical protein
MLGTLPTPFYPGSLEPVLVPEREAQWAALPSYMLDNTYTFLFTRSATRGRPSCAGQPA